MPRTLLDGLDSRVLIAPMLLFDCGGIGHPNQSGTTVSCSTRMRGPADVCCSTARYTTRRVSGSMTEAVSAGAGVRVDVWRNFGLRADGRVRYWDWNGEGFVNSSGEITAGLAYRF